jgi:hypothetical protein
MRQWQFTPLDILSFVAQDALVGANTPRVWLWRLEPNFTSLNVAMQPSVFRAQNVLANHDLDVRRCRFLLHGKEDRSNP